ncbi:MAG: 16S rRNA processing protein RimM [Ruminococcaceae bacterium]|nr:16S rRNA processing protein RimM [Oscillospiraceae bacterium]
MKEFLEIGKVNNTHGLKGEVKLEMWCDGIDYIRQLKTVYLDDGGNKPLSIVSARPQKNIAIMKFAEISTIEEAEELKNKVLFCNRNDAEIDDGAYYLADIIGCTVVDIESGREYGKIADIMNYGSSDIYDVVSGKKHSLIPAIPDVVKEIDTEKQIVLIKAMKGLFDED